MPIKISVHPFSILVSGSRCFLDPLQYLPAATLQMNPRPSRIVQQGSWLSLYTPSEYLSLLAPRLICSISFSSWRSWPVIQIRVFPWRFLCPYPPNLHCGTIFKGCAHDQLPATPLNNMLLAYHMEQWLVWYALIDASTVVSLSLILPANWSAWASAKFHLLQKSLELLTLQLGPVKLTQQPLLTVIYQLNELK